LNLNWKDGRGAPQTNDTHLPEQSQHS